jgi:hypothetical protein
MLVLGLIIFVFELLSECLILFYNLLCNFMNRNGDFDLVGCTDLKPHTLSAAPLAPMSYGYQNSSTSKKIDIPNGRVGVIIGKGGETIKYLQLQSGAKIQVTRDMDADPNSPTRMVELMGTPEQIAKAEQLITEVLSEVVLISLYSYFTLKHCFCFQCIKHYTAIAYWVKLNFV